MADLFGPALPPKLAAPPRAGGRFSGVRLRGGKHQCARCVQDLHAAHLAACLEFPGQAPLPGIGPEPVRWRYTEGGHEELMCTRHKVAAEQARDAPAGAKEANPCPAGTRADGSRGHG